MGWEAPPERQGTLGYGNFDAAVNTLEYAVTGKQFVAADQFSAADVYVGSMIDFMVMFKQIELRPAFAAYLGPLRERPAYIRAKQIDAKLQAG